MGCSGFRPSIDYRSRAKAGKLLGIGDQTAAQPAATDCYMYHMIATKHRADLCCGQDGREWQTPSQSTDLATPAFGSIQCGKQQRGFPGAHRFTDLLEAGNGETGSACETDRVAAALRQQNLDAVCKIRRYR
jgi:hypothetical protein